MPAVDYGKKHLCYSCGTKFYDLHKPKALCPKCGADQADAPAPGVEKEGRRPAPAKAASPFARRRPIAPVKEEEAEAEGSEDDEDEEDEELTLMEGDEEEEEDTEEESSKEDDD